MSIGSPISPSGLIASSSRTTSSPRWAPGSPGSPRVLGASHFFVGAAAQDADDFVLYNPATGALSYDADGSGSGAAVTFAQVTAGLGAHPQRPVRDLTDAGAADDVDPPENVGCDCGGVGGSVDG